MNTAVGAEELIDHAGEPNVLAHLDTFHMNLQEKGFRDPVPRPGRAAVRYGHLSESDRAATGSVCRDGLFGALTEIGFGGRLVLESFVHPNPGMTHLAALWPDVAEDLEELCMMARPFCVPKRRSTA